MAQVRLRKAAAKEEQAAQENADAAQIEAVEDESWDWNVSSHVVDDTKVSVQDVDAFTEFNVYKLNSVILIKQPNHLLLTWIKPKKWAC